ncbi:hypothetical protein AB0C93_20075 [Streptomyces sp. NPDC048518]|uniref:hypothetical protein n=1 Tax=Streptomyces sp. NPDC048518 TaxID=3155029 RepID=UPI0033EE5C3C
MNGIRMSVAARLAATAMTACLLGTAGTLAAAAAPPTAVAADKAGAWGDTKKWGDGLTITVSKPQKFTPSPYAVGHEAKNQAVKWRITVHNGSEEPFQGVLMTVNVKSGADGENCAQIFDGDKIGTGIEGTVSPGSSGTAVFGFDVPRGQLNKVDLEVRPNLDDHGEHWVGKVT